MPTDKEIPKKTGPGKETIQLMIKDAVAEERAKDDDTGEHEKAGADTDGRAMDMLGAQLERQDQSNYRNQRVLIMVIMVLVLLTAALSGAGLYFDVFGLIKGGSTEAIEARESPRSQPLFDDEADFEDEPAFEDDVDTGEPPLEGE